MVDNGTLTNQMTAKYDADGARLTKADAWTGTHNETRDGGVSASIEMRYRGASR